MRNRTKDAITATSTKELIRIHGQIHDPEGDPYTNVWAALAKDVEEELMRRFNSDDTPSAHKGRISGWMMGR